MIDSCLSRAILDTVKEEGDWYTWDMTAEKCNAIDVVSFFIYIKYGLKINLKLLQQLLVYCTDKV